MEEMLKCAQRGVTVTDLSTFFEREAGMVKLNVADPSWLAFSGGFDHSMPRRLSKRFFDLAAAGALLLAGLAVHAHRGGCVSRWSHEARSCTGRRGSARTGAVSS